MALVILLNNADTPLPQVLRGLETLLEPLSPLALGILSLLALIAVAGAVNMLAQGFRIREREHADAEFFDGYQLSEQPLEMYLARRIQAKSPCYRTYENACRELCQHLTGSFTINTELITRLRSAGRISPSQMDAVRHTLLHACESEAVGLNANIGKLPMKILAIIGLAGTLLLFMEQSFMALPPNLYPALLPATTALLLTLPLVLWRSVQASNIEKAASRLGQLAADWTRQVERRLVDHRKPLENLPSLETMSMQEGPTFSQSPAEMK